jgi:hypothetical protein
MAGLRNEDAKIVLLIVLEFPGKQIKEGSDGNSQNA